MAEVAPMVLEELSAEVWQNNNKEKQDYKEKQDHNNVNASLGEILID